MDGKVTIRLFAMEEGSGEALHDRPAVFDDPLYLTPSPSMPVTCPQELVIRSESRGC